MVVLGRSRTKSPNSMGVLPTKEPTFCSRERVSSVPDPAGGDISVSTSPGGICLVDPDQMGSAMALPALAELIMTAVVASKGTPIVVPGNCLLLELKSQERILGFVD